MGPLVKIPLELFGLPFPNHIGIGAGIDKDARIPNAWVLLGIGHIEVGTLSPFFQEGNEKPPLFRLREDECWRFTGPALHRSYL